MKFQQVKLLIILLLLSVMIQATNQNRNWKRFKNWEQNQGRRQYRNTAPAFLADVTESPDEYVSIVIMEPTTPHSTEATEATEATDPTQADDEETTTAAGAGCSEGIVTTTACAEKTTEEVIDYKGDKIESAVDEYYVDDDMAHPRGVKRGIKSWFKKVLGMKTTTKRPVVLPSFGNPKQQRDRTKRQKILRNYSNHKAFRNAQNAMKCTGQLCKSKNQIPMKTEVRLARPLSHYAGGFNIRQWREQIPLVASRQIENSKPEIIVELMKTEKPTTECADTMQIPDDEPEEDVPITEQPTQPSEDGEANAMFDAKIHVGKSFGDLMKEMISPGEKRIRILEDAGTVEKPQQMKWELIEDKINVED